MDRTERRWVVGWAIALGALVGLPVLWGLLFPPEGWQLYRTWTYGGDYTQYRSAMAQGYEGAWLIVNRFTPEPHTPVLQYPLYALLGHVARLARLPLELPYALTCAFAIFALALALYDFAAAFLPRVRDRRLAFALALSVGPAWVVLVLRALLPPLAPFLSRYSDAFNRPEVNTLLLFTAAPHLPLALALLLTGLATYYRDVNGAHPPPRTFILCYGLGPVALGLLNPFSLPTLLLPLGLWWLWRSARARRPLWTEALPLLAMGLAALPLVLYNVWAFSLDPFWGRAYGSQNTQASFPPDVVALGYGVMGALAVAGALKGEDDDAADVTGITGVAERRRLALWALVVLLMGYIPVRYQRRFSLGLAPALAVLAVGGWRWAARTRIAQRWRHRMLTRVVGSAAVVLLLWGQNLMYLYAYTASFLGRGPTPYAVFQPTALAEAAAYLDAQDGRVVVLTCEDVGNRLAGEIAGRVVLGHAGATLDVQQRRAWVRDWFAGRLAASEQAALAEAHGVTHLVTSSLESLPCGAAYEPGAAWRARFDAGGITVYERAP